MLTEPRRLAALLEQAYFGEAGRSGGIAWHGPSVRHVLDGLSAAAASVRSGQSHSIWEITLHIAFWDEVCRRRLSGERIDITTGDPGDWPDCPEATEANWQATRERLERAERELIDTVRHLEPGDLDRQTPGCAWTNYTMIHGTLHHDLYHAGQIALLKKTR